MGVVGPFGVFTVQVACVGWTAADSELLRFLESDEEIVFGMEVPGVVWKVGRVGRDCDATS